MKKILFLLILCIIKLNAYEYLVYSSSGTISEAYFLNENGNYFLKVFQNGNYSYSKSYDYVYFNNIKNTAGHHGYILKNEFDLYFKNDLNFLNDLYTSSDYNRNGFLNYLYNDSLFNSKNYINYLNYELLYNDKGLVVESIVDGVWSGLYSDIDKSKSGDLYNKNGSLIYYNGKEVTPAISFMVWLQKFTNKVVLEAFGEIQRSMVTVTIVAVVLVLALVRLVLELLPSSITPRRRRYYGGGRGSFQQDYGDGSQVAASVRARLAAKNRALKARAYDDRDVVKESMVNGILFDLENDR